MIDPTDYSDFELWIGDGDVLPDPLAEDDSEVTVPPLMGLADKLKALEVGEFVAVNCPRSANQIVSQRFVSAHRKLTKREAGRTFTISVEWFGVKLTRLT